MSLYISPYVKVDEKAKQNIDKIIKDNPQLSFISFSAESEEINPLIDNNPIYLSCYYKKDDIGIKYGIKMVEDDTYNFLNKKAPRPKELNKELILYKKNIIDFVELVKENTDDYSMLIEMIELSQYKEECYEKLGYYFNTNMQQGIKFLSCKPNLLNNNEVLLDSLCICSYYIDKNNLHNVAPYLLSKNITKPQIKSNINFYLQVLNLPIISFNSCYLIDLILTTFESEYIKYYRYEEKNIDKVGVLFLTNYKNSLSFYLNNITSDVVIYTDNIEKAKEFLGTNNVEYTQDINYFLSCRSFITGGCLLPFVTNKEVIFPSSLLCPFKCIYSPDPIYVSIVSQEDIKQSWPYYEVVKNLSECKYDIVAIHEQGDIWDNDKLQKQIRAYVSKKYDIIGCFVDKDMKEIINDKDFLTSYPLYYGSIICKKEFYSPNIHNLHLKGYTFYNIPELLVKTTKYKKDGDIKERYNKAVTIVTGFYRVNTGKYPKNYYNDWIKNFLSLDCNIVAFISEEDIETQKYIKESGKKNIVVIYKEIKQFHNYQYLSFYEWCYSVDQEKNLHCSDMYMIWNEKPFFVLEAIRLNPFSSEWFAWTDFGSCRSPDHARQVKGYGNVFSFLNDNVPKDKIIFYAVTPLNDKEKELNENNIPIVLGNISPDKSCNEIARFQGGFFKGHKDLWYNFCSLYDKEIQHFIKHNTFAGKEQNLFISLYIKYPQYIGWRMVSDKYYNKYFSFFNDHI
jgi:hypothetical protein